MVPSFLMLPTQCVKSLDPFRPSFLTDDLQCLGLHLSVISPSDFLFDTLSKLSMICSNVGIKFLQNANLCRPEGRPELAVWFAPQMVKHRWLEENAPLRMSPLHAAMAQNGLLGPEPLDLNDGAEPQKPPRASPVKFQLEAPAPPPASPPSAQEEAAPAAAVPAASVEEPAHLAADVSAAVAEEPAHAAPQLPAAKIEKPIPVLEAAPPPLRTASGRKRKQVKVLP